MARFSLPRISGESPVVLCFALIYSFVFALEALLGIPISERFLNCPASSSFDFTGILDYTKIVTHVLSRGGAGEFFPCLVCIVILGCGVEERYGSVMMLLMMLIADLVEGVVCVLVSPRALGGGFSFAFMMIILWGMESFSKKRIPLAWIFTALSFIVFEVTLLRPLTAAESFAPCALCVVIKLIAALLGSFPGLFTAPRSATRGGSADAEQSRARGETARHGSSLSETREEDSDATVQITPPKGVGTGPARASSSPRKKRKSSGEKAPKPRRK